MITDDPYPLCVILQANGILNPGLANESLFYLIGTFILLIVLITVSGMFSASESALFSFSNKDREALNDNSNSSNRAILRLLAQPKILLATIVVTNSFVNVTFVIVSSLWLQSIFNLQVNPIMDFAIKVIIVTLVILIFGDVVPKVYATRQPLTIARIMALPILFCQNLFSFLIYPMVKFTSLIDRRVRIHEHTVSADELTHAIDLTSDKHTGVQEKEILKGIVNFGNKTVRMIMKGRADVAALDINLSFDAMLLKVNELGYSRLPVYEGSFDNIIGILYIKEIIPYLYEHEKFDWRKILKPAFYVPDSKRIDLLLTEFQEQRMHMAIVVDEFGGKLGIVTMEDVLEEVFGEINDEFDEEPVNYSKIENNKYLIEGKLLINDLCKITDTEDSYFDEVKGDSDSVGGMLMELTGKIPARNETIKYRDFSFTVEAVDNRKVKRITVEILI